MKRIEPPANECERLYKADLWLSDARKMVLEEPESDQAEKDHYIAYIDVAKTLAGLLPEVETELARMQVGRESTDIDMLGIQVSMSLPELLHSIRDQVDAIKAEPRVA